MSNYDDIINLPCPTSQKHPRMSIYNRAAQFSPFAALTGHGDAIKETARITQAKIELGDELVTQLNRKLIYIKQNTDKSKKYSITYFIADKNKSGGKYVTITDEIIKIDDFKNILITSSGLKIPISDLLEIL